MGKKDKRKDYLPLHFPFEGFHLTLSSLAALLQCSPHTVFARGVCLCWGMCVYMCVGVCFGVFVYLYLYLYIQGCMHVSFFDVAV